MTQLVVLLDDLGHYFLYAAKGLRTLDTGHVGDELFTPRKAVGNFAADSL
jgi:hypothetical protein